MAHSWISVPQLAGSWKSKIPPVAVVTVWDGMESPELKRMTREPVCRIVEAFSIDGLFTTSTLNVSPAVKKVVATPAERVETCDTELVLTAVIKMVEVCKTGCLKSDMFKASSVCEQMAPSLHDIRSKADFENEVGSGKSAMFGALVPFICRLVRLYPDM